MPQVRYTTAKGLYQETGTSGVILNSPVMHRSLVSGLTYAVAATSNITPAADTLTAFAWVGAAQTCLLPAATAGVRVLIQLSTLASDTNALTFNCAGSDVIRTGSLIESRAGGLVVYDTSTVGETALVITQTATHSFVDQGTIVAWECLEAGTWDVSLLPKADPAGTGATGTVLFAA